MESFLSTYTKFSEKLLFLTALYTHKSAYQGDKNFSFSKYFTYVLNERFLWGNFVQGGQHVAVFRTLTFMPEHFGKNR